MANKVENLNRSELLLLDKKELVLYIKELRKDNAMFKKDKYQLKKQIDMLIANKENKSLEKRKINQNIAHLEFLLSIYMKSYDEAKSKVKIFENEIFTIQNCVC